MQKEREKMTSGRAKRTQAILELFNSSNFKEEIKKADKIGSERKKFKAYVKIAENYQLDFDIMDPLFKIYTKRKYFKGRLKKIDFDNYMIDVCRVYDMADEVLNPSFPADFLRPVMQNRRLKLDINAYPIHIGIAPLTSKRMLIEFINKNWNRISDLVNEYYDAPLKPSKRRRKEKRDGLIWNLYSKKKMKSSEIAEIIENRYPDENLTYTDINKIISRIKKRLSH